MYKKILTSLLMLALINFLVGCYSSTWVTVPEYKQVEEEEGKPDEIYVTTKESQKYHFSDSGYSVFYIENDTLYGKGDIVLDGIEQPFEGKFALSDIESIQFEQINRVTTFFLVLGIVAGILIIARAVVISSLSDMHLLGGK